jgi:hypothetical protein
MRDDPGPDSIGACTMKFGKSTTLLSMCLALAASGTALPQSNVQRAEYYQGIATNTP